MDLSVIQKHVNKAITVIGDDLLCRTEQGAPANAIATVFPCHRLIVTGQGIHAMQIHRALEYLQNEQPEETGIDRIDAICRDAVALHVRNACIIIRTDPYRMERVFLADELLQEIYPRECIRFTGLHQAQVREALARRGEIWRFSSAPVHQTDFDQLIQNCRVRIGTDTLYYHNKHTGEHILTLAEFSKIKPLLRTAPDQAALRIREILEFSRLINAQGYPEITFLVASDQAMEIQILEDVLQLLEKADPAADAGAEALFDQLLTRFSQIAGPGLTSDDTHCDAWRLAMMSRLFNIDEQTTSEWSLGLGPEFYLNIRWLSGARIIAGEAVFDPASDPRVRRLILHFTSTRNDCISINVGRIESPLTERDRTGEEREVYIVALERAGGAKEIRHIRMSKWDVRHRLKKGIPLAQAVSETRKYRDYIIDRHTAARALRLPIVHYEEICIEDACDSDIIPVYYFERDYVPGVVTCRISPFLYEGDNFIIRLADLLGRAAADSLVLGRTDPRTGRLYFDDGDEVIQLDPGGIPCNLVMIETTGSFNDWTSPLTRWAAHCADQMAVHINRARRQEMAETACKAAVDAFSGGLESEIRRMQALLDDADAGLIHLFENRSGEWGGIRCRWEGVLDRLRSAPVNSLRQMIEERLNQYPVSGD